MVVNSPPVPVDKRPKDLQPFNTTGVVQNTPEGKRKRKPPVLYIQEKVSNHLHHLSTLLLLFKKEWHSSNHRTIS